MSGLSLPRKAEPDLHSAGDGGEGGGYNGGPPERVHSPTYLTSRVPVLGDSGPSPPCSPVMGKEGSGRTGTHPQRKPTSTSTHHRVPHKQHSSHIGPGSGSTWAGLGRAKTSAPDPLGSSARAEATEQLCISQAFPLSG